MQCRDCTAKLPEDARFCLSCGARVDRQASEPPSDPVFEALNGAIGFQYRLERLLGRGGMGAVYLAHELALDRDVAIKVLPPDQAGAAPELRERFRREARTAARLTHSNIVPLHTFGEVAGLMYFVMGYVRGESLAARLQRQGPFDPEEARTLLAGMCEALAYAHRQGIVHRDIKPDNILLDAESGAPMLTDFGIAKGALADAQLTTAGQLIGTPHYMSPEQAMGRLDVGPQSDLYSLGVVAYELVSGRRPFEGATSMETLTERLTAQPRPIESVADHVPPDLAQVIARCLQRDPANRWPDAGSMREALLPSEDEPDFSPPARMLQTLATVLLPLTGLAIAYAYLASILTPGSESIGRLIRIAGGVAFGMVVATAAATVRLYREGRDLKTIVVKALQQPSWWRSWYPRSLRRRGDVWDRLPRSMRQFRVVKGLLLGFVWTVYLPIHALTLWLRRFETERQLLTVIALIGIAAMFWLRHRAFSEMRAKAGGPVPEASALLNSPTWRLSIWRRTPTGSLLLGQPSTRPAADGVPAGVSAAADTWHRTDDGNDEAPTGLS